MADQDEEIIACLRRIYEAFNRGDFEAALQIARPDIEFVRPGGQSSVRGRPQQDRAHGRGAARPRGCPNVTLVDVADSGHMVMMDQPARTAELILELVSADAGALKTS